MRRCLFSHSFKQFPNQRGYFSAPMVYIALTRCYNNLVFFVVVFFIVFCNRVICDHRNEQKTWCVEMSGLFSRNPNNLRHFPLR